MVLYRKYRPQTISELVGQDHIRQALLSSLNSGKIAHAYLFSGPRGSGKTTTARILAKSLNCQKSKANKVGFLEPCNKCDACTSITNGSYIDLIEIDAASNRGIDDIRDLREKIKLAPVVGKFKVYIIDEAHMLTNEAFNALLKTLEEPPSHAVFILCTTQVEKLPITIISRCNRFDFQKATIDELTAVLNSITKKEKIEITKEASLRISQVADGSFRDALTILDQLAAIGKKIDVSDVDKVFSYIGVDAIANFIDYLEENKGAKAIILVNDFVTKGGDLKRFADELLNYLRTMLFISQDLAESVRENYSADVFSRLEKQTSNWPKSKIGQALKLFSEAGSNLKLAIIPQLPLELAIVDFVGFDQSIDGNKTKIIEGKDLKPKKVENETETKAGDVDIEEKDVAGQIIPQTSDKNLLEKWPEFLKAIRKQNFSIEALLRLTRPVSLDGELLTIEVFYRFHKERIESLGVYRLISAVGEEVFGKNIKVNCLLGQRRVKTTVSDDLETAVNEIFAN